MVNICVYSYRTDEAVYFDKFSKKYNVNIKLCSEEPSLETVELAKGFECISIITTKMDKVLMEKLHDVGVKYISTRTIGYEHIDVECAKRLGMQAGNVTYSTDSVADYTVMMILMAARKAKSIIERASVQDYSLRGIQGKEIHNLVLGIIGTGKIGKTVARDMSGFGCKIIAYDIHPNREMEYYGKYVDIETLFRESDIITMHVPATRDNYHIINKESIEKMKKGVIIINTARGSLINTSDLIDGIESLKVGAASMDVIEGETGLYYEDKKCEIIKNRNMAVLKSYPNVIITPHTAFYTNQAVSDMVENSILSCIYFAEGKDNPWKITDFDD
jgi:D-lactate dehydrogenase